MARKWWATGIAVTILVALPAAAAAAPVDTASDHVALSAYGRYLQQVLSGLPAARSADDAYIAAITQRCPNVLAALNLLPSSAIKAAPLIAFGEEVGGDLVVEAYRSGRAPLATLTATLTRLTWSSPQTAATIDSFLTAQRKLFRLGPSHLCSDTQALAASVGQRSPRGTLRWLARFGRLVSAEQSTAARFLRVLEQFQAPDDGAQIDADNRIVRKSMTAFPALIKSEGQKLLKALGLSPN